MDYTLGLYSERSIYLGRGGVSKNAAAKLDIIYTSEVSENLDNICLMILHNDMKLF